MPLPCPLLSTVSLDEVRRNRLAVKGRGGILLGARTVAVIAALATPAHWHATDHPRWYREALCIHAHEGAWTANTGNGYYGGMQFLASTWASANGRGLASAATPRDQLYRAWIVYLRDGRSWREWGTARACGLR
jgi:hypothetical protein